MIKERSFGVAEARIGLSVITCLLVALGYVIVHRLGDASASNDVDSGSRPQSTQVNATPAGGPGVPALNSESDVRYGVPNSPSTGQTAYRPQWLSPQNDSPGVSLPTLGIDEPAAQQSDHFDPMLDPANSEIRSGLMPDANPKR
jgi:hypothetical protein